MTDQLPHAELTATPSPNGREAMVADSPAPARRPINWGAAAVSVVLLVLFWSGVFFRFNWRNWSEGTSLHPDEYGLTNTLTQLRLPASFEEYFNTRLSPLSPYNKYDAEGNVTGNGPDNGFVWGQWPVILLKWAGEVTGNSGYDEQRLLGRSLSATADTLALLLIYLIGARLYNRRVGLLAATLSALAVMQIQQSHFMTADTFGVLFAAAAMYCAVQISLPHPRAGHSPDGTLDARTGEGRLRGWALLFGVTCGMAIASRINLLPLAGMIVIAVVIAYAREWARAHDVVPVLRDAALVLILAGLAAVITFRLTHPMAFRAESGDTSLLTFNLNPDWRRSVEQSAALSNLDGGGPPAEQWTARAKIFFPLMNMVLWGMGLPLGLAAWAGFAWAGWRTVKDDWRAHLLPLVWVGGYFLFMGTRWVMSVRYFLPIYPFLCLFAAWALYELWQKAESRRQKAEGGMAAFRLLPSAFSMALFTIVIGGAFAWAWGFTSIYRNTNPRLVASRWMFQNIPGPFNLHLTLADGSTYTEPLPFPEGGLIGEDNTHVIEFKPRVSGTLAALSVAHARNEFDLATPGTLTFVVAGDPAGGERIAEATLPVAPSGKDERGDPASITLNGGALEKDQAYYLFVTAGGGGPIAVSGSTVSNESWDEPLPPGGLDGRSAFGGLYTGLQMEVQWLDDENKREMYLDNLAQADYVLVQSQRRLWSSTRLPSRYPMTMEYYRALWDGRLGFELAGTFHQPFVIGPLQVSDLTGTWAWGEPPAVPAPQSGERETRGVSPAQTSFAPARGPDFPFNYSPFAAEEAFSVYDHAPVWIFRKRADFDLEKASEVLHAVDLTTVTDMSPKEASRAPNLMQLPADLLAIQRAGGTWSEMFDADSPLNTTEPLAASVWYLAMLVMGVIAFPLTYLAFGGFADRGYPLARTVALLTVTWFVWFAGSLRLLPFTRNSIALGFGVLALISGLILWRRRAEIAEFVRARWRHIAIAEAVTLALFLLMLFIRAGNPDLWHPYKGGEKPMDFSYFNAVLKSTYFPPYDPWLAGGYLNYYYYGFVVAGLLTKLLGIVPALAYNLILPMLFSLVGVNAFCVAYNLVASGKWQLAGGREAGPSADPLIESNLSVAGVVNAVVSAPTEFEWSVAEAETPAVIGHQSAVTTSRPLTPNPYIAGLAAALFIVVLGNLAQLRTFIVGFQRSADRGALAQSALGDNDFTAFFHGAYRVATGQTTLGVALDSWYWDATRIIPIVNGGGSEITEFPFFTFLYADLHANMIVMPFAALAIAWAIAYLQGYGRGRGWMASFALWAVGGLVIGVTRPSHTWDYPMYLALGLAALVGAPLLAGEVKWSRASVFGVVWRALLLVGLATLLYYPFDQWVAPPLTDLQQWKNEKTPLEAFVYIHGLFLFVLVTFVLIEIRRWLAETPATVLNTARTWAGTLLLAGLAAVSVFALLLYLGVAVAWIALPVMLGAGLLVLRGRNALPPEKRAVLFMLGTGLAVTIFVDVAVLGGDRMNTIFKLYMQVWMLFSIGAAAALAWAWADLPRWGANARSGWTVGLSALVAIAALYTVTAANAKVKDRFIPYAADAGACRPLDGVVQPYAKGTPPDEQPWGLNGLNFMGFSAYCDADRFLPLTYDYDAIRWLQANVPGSPVIAEAQTFSLYKMSSRFAWNTGLPNVVGWDWHQRQQRGAAPTGFISTRGAEISLFYCAGADFLREDLTQWRVCNDTLSFNPEAAVILQDPAIALGYAEDFIARYDVGYIIVGTLERAYYPPAGLAKFDRLAAEGKLVTVYTNPGVTIYKVNNTLTAGQ
jgi:YYY domain-containing protein